MLASLSLWLAVMEVVVVKDPVLGQVGYRHGRSFERKSTPDVSDLGHNSSGRSHTQHMYFSGSS
jgi:hypothetical protein